MKVYTGQTTEGSKYFQRCVNLGWGECTQRGELGPRRDHSLGPRRLPWFFDNKAYSDWKRGEQFNEAQYLADLAVLNLCKNEFPAPDFIVVPDIVAGGEKSLKFSLGWVPMLSYLAPLYLVVQNGMSEARVERYLGSFAGIFVGGDDEWKTKTGERWVQFAHEHGKRCHIGRVGAFRKAAWARRIGADSIDTCYPYFGDWEFNRFELAVSGGQGDLF